MIIIIMAVQQRDQGRFFDIYFVMVAGFYMHILRAVGDEMCTCMGFLNAKVISGESWARIASLLDNLEFRPSPKC
jgi:hypothetical protein